MMRNQGTIYFIEYYLSLIVTPNEIGFFFFFFNVINRETKPWEVGNNDAVKNMVISIKGHLMNILSTFRDSMEPL